MRAFAVILVMVAASPAMVICAVAEWIIHKIKGDV
jgi:hypothetical protein